jgi:AcrR family transcriptional regulator
VMEELVTKAKNLFFSYGLKSISMDDLAREAGTSKKTIYQIVSDKNELVDKVVTDLVSCYGEAMAECRAVARNAVEEVILKTRAPFTTLAAINRNFFYELEKFFPAGWDKLVAYRQQVMLPSIVKNLQWGMEEGLYRPDLDAHFTAHVRLQQILTALNPKDFFQLTTDPQKLMNDLTEFFLHGIVTTKGKQLLNNYLKGYNEN